MFKIITGQNILRKEAASFIVEMNGMKKNHIGYCGTDVDQVLNVISDELTDIPFEKSFVGAQINGQLIGLIGCDVDIDDRYAEIWGPFVDPSYEIDVALAMWEILQKLIPANINYFDLFPNVENDLVQEFAKKLCFKQGKDQMILTYQQEQLVSVADYKRSVLTEQDYVKFIKLHDKTFPNTYYSGQEILERIDDIKQVFVVKSSERLIGYVYAEAEPAFDNGSIEFIAIDPGHHGQGYGKGLLKIALQWLFSFKEIEHIELCVSSDKQTAMGLYRSVGFKEKHELYYYSKEK
jgi:ribosomal protein S18 acetylase RimI-like enzyme